MSIHWVPIHHPLSIHCNPRRREKKKVYLEKKIDKEKPACQEIDRLEFVVVG